MRRSQLESKYFKNRSTENFRTYKKQKNVCSKLYKKERKKYFANLNNNKILDNKTFWKTVKPFFTNKGQQSRTITLVKDNCVISGDKNVAQTLNDYFNCAVDSLNITENRLLLTDTGSLIDPVEIAIKKFESHPSISDIKNNVQASKFSFSDVSQSDIEKEIVKLKSDKASTYKNISAKKIKQTMNLCSKSL